MKLVSVVIPTYRRGEMLCEAVKSVVRQSYKYAEIVVVDDNTDHFEKEKVRLAVNSIDCDRVRVVDNTRAKGACGARNAGILSAKGEYIAFLDDDDQWHSEKLAKQIELLENGDGVGALCNYYDVDLSTGNVRECTFSGESYTLDMAIRGECPTSTSLVMVRKDVLLEAGLFDEKLPSFQDFDMWIRCLKFGKFGCVHQPLVKIIQHSSERISVNLEKRIAGLDVIEGKWSTIMNENWEEFRNTKIIDVLIANARGLIDSDYWGAVKLIWKAMLLASFNSRTLFWAVVLGGGAGSSRVLYSVYIYIRNKINKENFRIAEIQSDGWL